MDTEEINAPDLEDTELDNAEAEPTDGAEAEAGDEAPEAATSEEDGPLVVSFGEDEPELEPDNAAPEWVKELRRQNREQAKRIKELEQATQPAVQTEIGPEPTLADHDYDEVEFKQAWRKWNEKATEVEKAKQAKIEQERAAEEDFNRRLAAYNEAKAKLPVQDFDDAEAVLLEQFDATQQGLLVKLAKQPALFAYALGKNPTKAKTLAAIKDPVDFIAAAVRMEMDMKQAKRAPAPEKVLSGGVPGATAVDNRLEKLREEAARTGDFTKVNAYKRSLRG